MGVFRRTVVPAGLMGSRGLMAAVVTEPGAATGAAEVLGGAVIRDCWLLSRVCRRAGRLFCGDTQVCDISTNRRSSSNNSSTNCSTVVP